MNNQAIFAWIDNQSSNMRQTLEDWVAINSGTSNLLGLSKMADCLEASFHSLEADAERISLPERCFINNAGQDVTQTFGDALRFRKRPDAPFQILLCGHMDTVYSLDHPFQTIKPLDNDKLNGPGVSDMKGGLLVMLYSLLALEQSEYRDHIGWEVIINSDEEIGSPGSAALLAETAKGKHVGLVFEPAMQPNGLLAGERKGSAKYTVVAHGHAAHAGRNFSSGANAIVALSHFIEGLDQLNGQRDGLTLNVGEVQGGRATNVVPDLALCQIDVRMDALDDEVWAYEQSKILIDRLNKKEGIRLELHRTLSRQPKRMTAKSQALFECLRDAGKQLDLTIEWQACGGCCDGNNLAAAGLAVIDSLGVRGGNIHSENEYIILASLVERAKLTTQLLLRLASGNYDDIFKQ